MDYFLLHAVVDEINAHTAQCRVRDIVMPEWHQLFMVLSNQRVLAFSALASPNYLALAPQGYQIAGVDRDYPFGRILRHSLKGAYLLKAALFGVGERLVRLTFGTVNEGRKQKFHLVFEVMGRHSNLFFLSEAKEILAVLKENSDLSTARPLLNGSSYSPPPSSNRAWPEHGTDFSDLPQAKKSIAFPPYLIEYFHRFPDEFSPFMQAIEAKHYQCVRHEFGTREFYSVVPLTHAAIQEYFTSPSALLLQEKQRERSGWMVQRDKLVRRIDELIARERERIVEFTTEKEKRQNYHDLLKQAELLKAHLYVPIVENSVHCVDYATNTTMDIPIPPDTTPTEYMNTLFIRARKDRTALFHLAAQIMKREERLATLEQEQYHLRWAQGMEEVVATREWLLGQKTLPKKGKRNQNKGISRIKRLEVEGYEVAVGLSSRANDEVTLSARPDDWWFHAKDIPGSHVVIRAHNRAEPPENVLFTVAAIAAYYSRASDATKVEVDATRRKYVRKVAGAATGLVYYTHQRNFIISAEAMQNVPSLTLC